MTFTLIPSRRSEAVAVLRSAAELSNSERFRQMDAADSQLLGILAATLASEFDDVDGRANLPVLASAFDTLAGWREREIEIALMDDVFDVLEESGVQLLLEHSSIELRRIYNIWSSNS